MEECYIGGNIGTVWCLILPLDLLKTALFVNNMCTKAVIWFSYTIFIEILGGIFEIVLEF